MTLRERLFRWLFKNENVYELLIMTKPKDNDNLSINTSLCLDYNTAALRMHEEINDYIFEHGARIVGKTNTGDMDLDMEGKRISYRITRKKIL